MARSSEQLFSAVLLVLCLTAHRFPESRIKSGVIYSNYGAGSLAVLKVLIQKQCSVLKIGHFLLHIKLEKVFNKLRVRDNSYLFLLLRLFVLE